MKTEQYIITNDLLQGTLGAQADLVLLFGATKGIKAKGLIDIVRQHIRKRVFSDVPLQARSWGYKSLMIL
jgi:hypothetical protein